MSKFYQAQTACCMIGEFENSKKMKRLASHCHNNKISNFQCYLQMIDVYSTVYKPERWTYERRYTKVKDKRAEIYAAITTFPSHSGVPPGFLHSNECNLDADYT
jgi:hypothetical protein